MKILSRDFTFQERLLLIFLSLVLVGLFYYQFVDQPVRTALNSCATEKASLQVELEAVNNQISVLTQMQEELDGIRVSGRVSKMESYNNSKAELALLNDALKYTTRYVITFADVTREGDQIRRDFSLQFSAPDYDTMKTVLSQLAVSPYRCLIGDINCTTSRYNDATSEIQVNATATFYETMVGGTPDAGLPADTSEDASGVSSFDSAVVGQHAAEAGASALG